MLPAIAFLLGTGTDQSGRTVADYLSWSPEKWQEGHDYIQWAFPTKTQSAFNPNAPVIPDEYHPGDLPLYDYLLVSRNIHDLLDKYMASLGVTIDHDEVMGYVFNYSEDSLREWAYSANHNLLRMTRLLECLGVFGLTYIRDALFEFLLYSVVPLNGNAINSKTVAFWVAAKENKLHRLR